jgi:hypothetical protein
MQYKSTIGTKMQSLSLTTWYKILKMKLKEGKSVAILMDEREKQGKYLSYKTVLAQIKPKYRKQVSVYEMGRRGYSCSTASSDYLFCLGQRERDWKRFEQEAHRFDQIRNNQVHLVFVEK